MTVLAAAHESVNYYQALTIGGDALQGAIDISGYAFKATFERQAGVPEFTLDMAESELAEGFAIASGANRLLTIRILAETLQDVGDTTGSFTLDADLLATPPGGERFWVADLTLTVIKGPTE